jgi:hypothetical protein
LNKLLREDNNIEAFSPNVDFDVTSKDEKMMTASPSQPVASLQEKPSKPAASLQEKIVVTPPRKTIGKKVRTEDDMIPVGKSAFASTGKNVDFVSPSDLFTDDFVPLELVKKRLPEFFLVKLKGGLEVIYCDNGSMEGFIKPLTDYLFVNKLEGREYQTRKFMVSKGKLIGHVFRRESKGNNTAMLKGDGSKYKRTLLLCYTGPNGSSKSDQEQVLMMLKEVSGIPIEST